MSTHTKTTHVAATFHVESWDEKPLGESPTLPKLTRAIVKVSIQGDFQGSGEREYLMAYRADGTADFVAIERMTGNSSDRKGSFVLKGMGTFDGKVARGDLTVVEGTGTGDFEGVRGRGEFEAQMGPDGTLTLDLEL